MNLTHSIKPIKAKRFMAWEGFSACWWAFEGVFILPSVKGILANLACADKGKLEVDADIIPCEMVFIASK
ncbi:MULTISPECIES: hypothetical protein [unclassified Bartonella]|uniref:hypothetical protein n=1 Tax=unclassified Bartonella TaxID=2645622 RepID=UPI0023623D23|nr:hypothetical protein [Bartonella sp. CM31XJBT]